MARARSLSSGRASWLPAGRDRVLVLLKVRGPQTAAELAKRLGVTAMAVRQHLGALHSEGLVTYTDQRGEVGRPARRWQLMPKAHLRFMDSHADLSVDLLRAAAEAFGQEGLHRLTERRLRQQIELWTRRIPPRAALRARVARLARILRQQGYMAEWRTQPGGHFTLLENHCAIRQAARACPALCECELALFRSVLGADTAVERVEHTLNGDRRCAYRISGAPEGRRNPQANRAS